MTPEKPRNLRFNSGTSELEGRDIATRNFPPPVLANVKNTWKSVYVTMDASCSPKGLFTKNKNIGKLPMVMHRKMIVSTSERGCEIDTSLHRSENGQRSIKSGRGSNEAMRGVGCNDDSDASESPVE
jgi:hypothetical protein